MRILYKKISILLLLLILVFASCVAAIEFDNIAQAKFYAFKNLIGNDQITIKYDAAGKKIFVIPDSVPKSTSSDQKVGPIDNQIDSIDDQIDPIDEFVKSGIVTGPSTGTGIQSGDQSGTAVQSGGQPGTAAQPGDQSGTTVQSGDRSDSAVQSGDQPGTGTQSGTGGNLNSYSNSYKSQTEVKKVTLNDDLAHLSAAFGFIFTGNIPGFFEEILKAVPLIGIFLLIYAVAHYAAVITIFRKEEHKKFANIFAIGLAIVGIMSPPVFDIIRNLLGNSLLTILFMLIFIFMIIIFFKRLKTNSIESSTDNYKAKSKLLAAEKEFNKIEHGLLKDKKLEQQDIHEITQIKHANEKLMHENGDMKAQLEHLRTLAKEAAHDKAPSHKDKDNKMAIAKAKSIAAGIQKELSGIYMLKNTLKALENNNIEELKDDVFEEKDFIKFKKYLNKSHSIDMNVLNDNEKLEEEFIGICATQKQVLRYIKILKKFINNIEDDVKDIEKYLSKYKSNMSNGDYKEAEENTKTMEKLVKKITAETEKVLREDGLIFKDILEINYEKREDEKAIKTLADKIKWVVENLPSEKSI